MRDALNAKGVTTDLLVIEGGGHGFRGADAERGNKAWVGWFEEHLRNSPGKPSAMNSTDQ
jgi:dipeptidyl aminopeptidase/acylaminoacyl peptidase